MLIEDQPKINIDLLIENEKQKTIIQMNKEKEDAIAQIRKETQQEIQSERERIQKERELIERKEKELEKERQRIHRERERIEREEKEKQAKLDREREKLERKEKEQQFKLEREREKLERERELLFQQAMKLSNDKREQNDGMEMSITTNQRLNFQAEPSLILRMNNLDNEEDKEEVESSGVDENFRTPPTRQVNYDLIRQENSKSQSEISSMSRTIFITIFVN